MKICCFTVASMILRIKEDPFSFEQITRVRSKQFMKSYPNGLSRFDVNKIFNENHVGEYYFKRKSNIYCLDLEENDNKVVLHCIMSNDNDISSFVNVYKHMKDKIEKEHALFIDKRFKEG